MDGGVLASRVSLLIASFEKQFFIERGCGRDFGGTRFLTRYIADRKISGWTSSMDSVSQNVVLRKRDQPGLNLIQPESLILAQSERWRQA